MYNVFIGDYLPVLKVVFAKLDSVLVVIEKKNNDSDVASFCKENKIPCYQVASKADLDSWADSQRFNHVVVASFGILFSNYFISQCNAIFNFHAGNVYSCRGKHPLPAAIKRGDNNMALSVHEIDGEAIDKGGLFAQYFIALDYETSYQENYKRLLSVLTFLAEELCAFLAKNKKPPLWKWQPRSDSYLKKLSGNELEKMMSLDKIKEF